MHNSTTRQATTTISTNTYRRFHALQRAEETFELLVTGSSPLTLDGTKLEHGLPARPIDLAEVRGILLRPDTTDALKDAVWAELIQRARSGDSAWVMGCVGVALPGLKAVAGRAARTAPADMTDDIVAEMLTEFVTQLRRVDLGRPHICERMLLWARKGALRAKAREARHDRGNDADWTHPQPDPALDTPARVLAEAVRQKVITQQAAELINATRLAGIQLIDYASAKGVPADRLFKRRARAEARLVTAIEQGQVSVITLATVSNHDR